MSLRKSKTPLLPSGVSKYGYKYGVIRHEHPVGYRHMSSFLSAEPPDAPAEYDKTKGADGFKMLGNGPDPTLTVNGGNPVGDCGFVMTVNNCYVDACETDEPFTMPTSNVVVTDYLRYDHGQDLGVVNSQLFQYWRTVGLPWGGKLVGSAGVTSADWDATWAYMYAFGGGCTAITVTETMEDQTNAGEPWDITGKPSDDNVLGGHDVYVFARQAGSGGDLGVLATWGQRQLFTQRWWLKYVQELDVTITNKQIERKGNGYGVDVAKLEAYMASLGKA